MAETSSGRIAAKLKSALLGSREFIATALIGFSVTAAVVTATQFAFGERTGTETLDGRQSAEIAGLRQQIDVLKRDVYSEGAPVAPVDEGRVLRLEDEFKAIRGILDNNVERALAVPLLRKDLDRLEKQVTGDIKSLQDDVDRLYDALLWLIGIFVTTALAALGLLISMRKPSAA